MRAIDLYTAYGEASSWFAPEILAIGAAKIEGFIAANATLKSRFDFYLRNTLRQAPHTLERERRSIACRHRRAAAGTRRYSWSAGRVRHSLADITLSTGKSVRLDDQGYTQVRDAPTAPIARKCSTRSGPPMAQFRNSLGAAICRSSRPMCST